MISKNVRCSKKFNGARLLCFQLAYTISVAHTFQLMIVMYLNFILLAAVAALFIYNASYRQTRNYKLSTLKVELLQGGCNFGMIYDLVCDILTIISYYFIMYMRLMLLSTFNIC